MQTLVGDILIAHNILAALRLSGVACCNNGSSVNTACSVSSPVLCLFLGGRGGRGSLAGAALAEAELSGALVLSASKREAADCLSGENGAKISKIFM